MLPLFLLLHVFTHTFSASAAASSLPFDAAALLAFKSKSDLGNRLRFFVNRSSLYDTHCSWPGVQCSSESKVTRLVLEGYGLNGTLANGTLGRLDQLRILSLKGNSLTGPVPDLSGLVNLKALFLGHNQFAGPFPASIFSLHRLRTLDLSHNNFTGPISSNINSLDRLYCLRLESNLFNGSIPPLNQTTLRIFNVSKNELTGAIPVTDTLSAFDASAFSENPGLCGEVVRKECHSHLFFFHGRPGSNSMAPAPAAAAVKGGQLDDQGFTLPVSGSGPSGSLAQKFRRRATVAIGFLAGAFLVIGFVAVLIVMKNNRRRMWQGKILSPEKNSEVLVESNIIENSSNVINPIDQIENSNNELVAATAMSEEKVKKLGKSGCLFFCAGEAQVYTLEQLMRASAEMLGRGSVGSTYKAVLDNRLIVSVKRLDATKMGPTGKEAFERHMDAVGRLRHPNLVPLRAFFQAKEERLLVYDYQPNGSLFSLIHGSRSTRAKPLHWTSCLKIAEDVAQGLAYIHQASRLVHGNLKSSNVLLGADFEACLTDYCLLSLVEPSDGEDESGYQAPEIKKSIHQLTPRSDIYSFGVLLLELLTGKPPLQHTALIATDLPAWVRSGREDEGTDDERLMTIVDIAVFCVRSPPESRPTTYQVLKMLQEVKETDTEDHDNESSFVP